MKRAIVLSGGGAKGGYEMGVWKALRRLNIKYDIVTGTSVGSLLATLMVQKDYNKALKIWYFMDYSKVIDIEIKGKFKTKKGKEEIIKKYAKAAITGGCEMIGLEKVIDKSLNENKFFKSSIDFGLVTTYFPSLKGKFINKKDLKKGELKKYLLASCSCFPAFKPTKIDKDLYIDGGYTDNLPINLAVDLGADEIIAVDLGAVGVVRKINNNNVKITYIKPKNNLGNFLAFEKDYARLAINFGFNDTMKVFKKLEGNEYTFKLGSLKRNYNKNKKRFNELCNFYIENFLNSNLYKKKIENNEESYFNKLIEMNAKIFSIDPSKIYKASLLNILIKKELLKTKTTVSFNKILEKNNVKKNCINKELIYFIYKEIKKGNKKRIKNLFKLFPESFMCAIYLIIITK